ncbi:LLM class flavin-dependent oxidoreductase [Streptomyces sp. N2-109]|uniref:LLM class flavin-dependent oxidoreductase n=1 Tax=Streptomyces gossypii TaxID=2883101 RepID=A0ABT2K3V7_9ACTN|nr:LLM class flavin-dependent oxidoreductase [Streptomyces gossypii]MCT2594781.1 LLM class flavin-dependent oxidoreductase [Streptomyces gossypii]
MRYSLVLPPNIARPEQAVPFAVLTQRTAVHRLWQGHGLMLDSHHLMTWLAGLGIRVPSGFGVSLMPLRSPYQAAMEARSVALSTGRSVVACFGPGGPAGQRSFQGRRYASQLGACREYVQIVRRLLAGGETRVSGAEFATSARLVDLPAPPVSVGLGVLRERMALLAGEVADAAVTWLGSASYLDGTLLPALRKGAESRVQEGADADAGADPSARPRPPKVTAYVPVALSGPDRTAAELAHAGCGAHLRAPHYRDALRRSGIALEGDDSPDDAKKLVDGGVFLYGTVEEIHARLDEYRAIGVDEVVLHTTGVALNKGLRAAVRDLERILEAVPGHPEECSDD